MIAINVDNVSFTYFSEPVLSQLSWEIHDDRVVGLVGPNGSGKSTLLQMINGNLVQDTGFIKKKPGLTTGYLPQEPELNQENSLWIEIISAHKELIQIEQDLQAVEKRLGYPSVFNNPNKLANEIDHQAKLIDDYNSLGGPGFEGHVRSILKKLGFISDDYSQRISNLSGGQKKMAGLAKLIITKPDILLLDEPDNHLDIAGKDFLINFIRTYPGAVVIVSHDRYLLDLAIDEIADLDHGKLKIYQGNYSEFSFEKQNYLNQQQRRYQAQQKEVNRLEQSAKRLLSWGDIHDNEKFIKRGQNILKRIERMDKIDRPVLERETMGLELTGWRGSDKVIEIECLDKVFEIGKQESVLENSPYQNANEIFNNLECIVMHGERIGLIGPNGSGKSVLFQMILGNEPISKGKIKLGPSTKIGYYAQEHQILNYSKTLIDTIRQAAPISESNAVAFLGRFMFDYDQTRDQVSTLSGGERSRLQMALLMLSGANVLLLDEPTNNLDIQSAEVLEDVLTQYEGTILVISHDRYFLDRVVRKVFEIDNKKLVTYTGNFSEYQRQKIKQTQ